jgi:hypothetical protein
MMAFGDRLHWERFYQAMTNYAAARMYIKAFFAYSVALFIFLLGNLGTRAISAFWFFKKIKLLKKALPAEVILTSIVIGGIALAMLFVQSGTAWNTIQFFYYSLFFLGIFSGIYLSKLLDRGRGVGKWLLMVFVVFLTLPTTVSTMQHYLAAKPQAKISKDELSALKFLRSQPQGVVVSLQIPGVTYDKEEFPIPLYSYDSTAYVSAFSQKPVYLEDLVNLNIMAYNWPERLRKIKVFLANTNSLDAAKFLKDENISYVYLLKRNGVGLDEAALNIQNIYDNDTVIVFKVLKADVK